MRLKKYVQVRRESFGGLIQCGDSWQTILFVIPEVIEALEQRTANLDLRCFLENRCVLERETDDEPNPAAQSNYELTELTIPKGESHLGAPINVAIEITNQCNLSCPHCANRAGAIGHGGLSTTEVAHLLEEFSRMKVFLVTITGGEPFVRPDLPELLQYADELGLRVIVLTNGLLINPGVLARLPQSVALQVSLDGLGTEYEAIRGSGTFNQVLRVLDWLADDRRSVGATMVLTRSNSSEAPKLMQFCLSRGIRLKIDPLLPLGRALDKWDNLAPTAADAVHFVEARALKIAHYSALYGARFPSGRPLNVFDLPEIFSALFAACEGGRTDLWIKYNGVVFPCANLSAIDNYAVGDIRKTTCQTIWRGSGALEEFRSLTWSSFPLCKCCDIGPFCTFKCPASSLSYHGDARTCGANDFVKQVIRLARDRGLTHRIDGL
jgi:radical SAM protein with 4Fe4S-binding SPASM domain